jgi:hypothetical protein
MRMPADMPTAPRHINHPIYAFNSPGVAVVLQGPFDWVPGVGQALAIARCTACCAGKAGTVACVARCLATGQACDGGLNNCSSC